MCPHCGHILQPGDLIPLFSWLWLKGRCRYCKAGISVQYPLVEFGTASLFLLSYLVWPYGFDVAGIALLIGWLIVLLGLIALMIYDFRWMRLPFIITYPLIVFWLSLLVVMTVFGEPRISIINAITGAIMFGGFFWILHTASDGRWIGGGDVPLVILLGMLSGSVLGSMLVLFLASTLGTLYALPLMAIGKLTPKSRIPFGPFLIAAGIVVFLYGSLLQDMLRAMLLL
jgi:leader peptidase (prepilin peptidase)/N-methyltransferase